MKMHCQAEVKKELDKVLPTAVEQRLRDLPFEMVCVYKFKWDRENSVISYDHITLEFNNSDRPGGADGSMNIETGVFTTVTSGYYIITVSGIATVHAGFYSDLFLYHNGVPVQESQFATSLSGGEFIFEQGSRTVVSFACLLHQIFSFFSLRSFTCWLATPWILGPTTSDLKTIVFSFTG